MKCEMPFCSAFSRREPDSSSLESALASDFLAALAARKRKTIRRERQDALQNGITVHWLTGRDLTEDAWDHFFAFYMETGSRKWGRPYLTRPFFSLVTEAMRDRILLVMAKRAGRWIAGALNFIGSHTLLSSDRIRDRKQNVSRRGRRAGRA